MPVIGGNVSTPVASIMAGAGIDPTGATDSTTALQAAINATPVGTVSILPAGIYSFSSLTLAGGRRLFGAGYTVKRDALTAFGAGNYATAGNFAGTVLRSTATSGAAITVVEAGYNARMDLDGFVLIGPGSGTSTGIAVGDATHSVVGGRWPNVMVCNFATGVSMRNTEDCVFGLVIRGCTAAVTLATNTNHNTFTGLDVQQCVNGVTDDTTCVANLFQNPIFQGNTGTSVTLTGNLEKIVAGYWENSSGVRAVDITGGVSNSIDSPRLTTVNDGVRIGSVPYSTLLTNPTSGGPAPISNAGIGTILVGDFTTTVTLTDTGTRTIQLDANSTKGKLPPVANFTLTGAASGTASVLFGDDGGGPAWQISKINADAHLYIKDVVNNRFPLYLIAGAAANASAVVFGAIPLWPSSNTAGRPSAATWGAGACWYDTTLGKPIWSNGSVWKDASGTTV